MNKQVDVVLSAEDAATAIQQLSARAGQLERQIDWERSQAQQRVVEALPDVLRYLRMHGIVLLNLGTGKAEDLRDRVSDPAAVAALTEAWNIANAPLSPQVIEQVRVAADCGNRRW